MNHQLPIKRRLKSEDDEEYFVGFDENPCKSSNKNKSNESGRHDNSLGVLTKKFVQLIQDADDKTIDLNDAVKILGVQKRRIYDITNVLEGIGLIQKSNKNRIQWVGETEGSSYTEAARMEKELEDLCNEEKEIDHWINQMTESLNQLTKDPSYAEHAYATFDDIKSLGNLTDAENETLLAIRAPPGTSLEVPDPETFPAEEKEKYQVYLSSRTGEILVYVVTNGKLNMNTEHKLYSTDS